MTEDNELIDAAKVLHARKRAWMRENGTDTPAWDSPDLDPRFRQSLIDDARTVRDALTAYRNHEVEL